MPTSYSCICFDTELLCDGELKRGIKVASGGFISKNEPYTAAIRNYVENAVSACEEKYVGWELDAVGNMSLLFSAVKKDLKLTEKAANHKEANFGRVAMNYIIENYHSAATSRDAADAMHMNHSYFCRMFKKTFGCCFANYVLAYRLEKAQAFLKSTSLSVTEVAFKVGFNNCSYFGKTFRERFGVTPLDMKKRNAIRASES